LVSNNVSNVATLCQIDSRAISVLSVAVKYGQHPILEDLGASTNSARYYNKRRF
jgi:hypothetical protein